MTPALYKVVPGESDDDQFYSYDAYGNFEELEDDAPHPGFQKMFTGHFFHRATGLYLAPYRAYDPQIGRWLSREPLGLDGPNLYHYVFNSPTTKVDNTGLQADITDFMDPTDPAYPTFADPNYPSSANVITIPMHGGPDGFYKFDPTAKTWAKIPIMDIIRKIKSHPKYDSCTRISLCFSCQIAQHPTIPQAMADALDRTIMAPTEYVWPIAGRFTGIYDGNIWRGADGRSYGTINFSVPGHALPFFPRP